MAPKRWTDKKREDAIALYSEHGCREASRLTGVPRSTILHWAQAVGAECGNQASDVVALKASLDLKRHRLAAEFYATAEQLLAQVFEPAKVFQFDKDGEFHEAELGEPTFADKRACVTAAAICVDKGQVLTGQATQRVVSAEEELAEVVGTVDELRAVRERRAS